MNAISLIDKYYFDKKSEITLDLHDRSSLEVVFKIQETCNINCKYCYMYNVGNELYKKMPTRASLKTCESVADLIITEFKRRNPSYVRLILHGGEPMLMRPEAFDERMTLMADRLRANLAPGQYAKIQYVIQTNATLVNDAWIALIEKWNIGLGVSIDGYAEAHDQRRIDKKERGTHASVVAGIQRLQAAEAQGRIGRFGALCVVNPDADGERVYQHLAHELGFSSFDFLLPFMNWDDASEETLEKTRAYILGAFKAWRRDLRARRTVRVRLFTRLMGSLRTPGGASGSKVELPHYVVIVESDGSILPEESLRPAYDGHFSPMSVHRNTLSEVIADPRFYTTLAATLEQSEECSECALIGHCRSGQALGRIGMRFSSERLFERKSVYCSLFQDLFVEGAALLYEDNKAGRTPLLGDVEVDNWTFDA